MKNTAELERPAPIKIAHSTSSYTHEENRIHAIGPLLTRLAQAKHDAGVKPGQVDDRKLITDPRRELLTLQSETFQMMAINMSSLNLLSWGEYQPLIDLCEELSRKTEVLNYLEYYTIANGEATINKSKLKELYESYWVYASTEAEQKKYNLVKTICDALNAYEADEASHKIPYFVKFKHYLNKQEGLREIMPKILAEDRDGKFIPNSDYVKI